MFSVGEKVRYLDEVGEATVIRIIDAKTVLLEDEFGLTHPYPSSKLVSAERHHSPREKSAVIKQDEVSVPAAKPKTNRPALKLNPLPELALVFESTHANKPETGDLELQFVNNTKYHLLTAISAKEGEEWFCLYNGEILPNSDEPIQTLRRQDIGNVSNMHVDVIFFGRTGFQPRKPVSSRLKVKTTRFVKSGNFLSYEGMENPAIVIPIEQEPKPTQPSSAAPAKRPAIRPNISKPSLPVFEDEIDLHLEAIPGADPFDMPDHEKFLTQMRHFERNLNHALTHKYVQITFIHGVGSGRLKEAIRKELEEYGLPYEDGPFHKYGVGATVVRLN